MNSDSPIRLNTRRPASTAKADPRTHPPSPRLRRAGRRTDPQTHEKQPLFPRGIFSSAKQAWITVALYTMVLYASLQATLDAYMWAFERIGGESMSLLLNVGYAVAGAALLGFVAFRLPVRARVYAAFVALAVTAAVTLQLQEVPANRIHFLQYGPLTVLTLDALRFHANNRWIFLWTLLLVTSIGGGDELLQSLSPQRRFDPSDIGLNALAAALSLAFVAFVVGPRHYPYGKALNGD